MSQITPPATIGMLGGGQLGRYAIMAARIMGYRTIVLDPDPQAPAGRAADVHLIADYDDLAANDQLARECQVVTTEFENPPSSALERLAGRTTVRPAARAVALAQNRVTEKRFLVDCGVPVGPYDVIDSPDAPITVSFPARLKTARLGYDGKGQRVVHAATEVRLAWTQMGSVACVLEQALSLDQELSVVCARSVVGEFAAYDVTENVHVDGVLDISVVPARTTAELANRAVTMARTIADAFEYVGVLAVEFFVVEGELIVNEVAPRPHNSGHWTIDVALTSQFEQQIRAVTGSALGDTSLAAPAAAMVNLMGDLWANGEPQWAKALVDPRLAVHLYGKTTARPGRKMGHFTVWGDEVSSAAARALVARRSVVGESSV